ncbi:hypothetical protein [Streptomyces sp. BBFR102]|uniref:hypothetical protein n=1 Tax=Streptomyces sp. BBFR102 TaxID=3448171 RepID=UPI003F52DB52
MPTTWYPYDNGTVGPTGPEGPQGPPGAKGEAGVVQSVNGQGVENVVLAASDVNALPSNANATVSASYMSIDRPAGNYRAFRWLTAGASRWEAQADDVAETGSAAGSDFRLAARNDDGSFNKTVIHAKRSDGTISFGTTVHHGSAQVTSYGAVGLRDIAADPATTSGGTYVYSKSGKMFVKQADGTSFQIAQVSYPVTSVNGHTGNVTLGAADMNALPLIGTVEGANLSIKGNGAGPLTVYGGTATDERFAVKASGSWYSNGMTNTAYNMGVGDTASDFAGGKYVLAFKDRSIAPTRPPVAGAVMYAEEGKLKVLQSDGTTFQLAPGGGGGEGGGGAVDSVNGKVGAVTLDASEVNALPLAGGTLDGPLNISPTSGNTFTAFGSEDPATYFRVTAAGHAYSNSLRSTFYNLGVGDTTADFAGGKFALALKNANIVPTGNPANGVVTYAEAGKLKVRQSDGTIVTVANAPVSSVNGQTGAVSFDIGDLGGVAWTDRGAVNGVASLDSGQRVPVAQLPDVAAPGEFTPTDLGLKGWAFDPVLTQSTPAFSGTTTRFAAVKLAAPATISRIVWHFGGYSGGLISGSWAAIYNTARTRVGTATTIEAGNEPAEQHGEGGMASYTTLDSAVTLPAGIYYVAWRFNYNTTTGDGPMILGLENSFGGPANQFGVNGVWRFGVISGTNTTAPTTFPTSPGTGGNRFWVALA